MVGDSRYKIEEEIARGGMGVVLRVKDGDLDRTLAMKKMASAPDETMGGSEASRFARFMEEAQVTAQLDHPAIVPVHELGFDEDGTGWYTMKLVEGRELGQVFDLARSKAEGWNDAKVLRVLVQVCQALSYAHGKGVIHRDLKPANIMVGEFGEVYVMDWGLARVEGNEVISPREDDEISGGGMTTLDGSVMGTPEFMSPEQARGEEADERSDVYSVGAILYHFLAGKPPYQGEAREVVKQVAEEGAQPLPSGVRRELAKICEKGMSRERGERYQAVGELGDDLQRYLDGQVVQAYESGSWAELKKLVGRNKGIAGSLAAVIASLVALLALQVSAKREVEKSRGEAVFALEVMAVSQGERASENLDYGRAAYWFRKASTQGNDAERQRLNIVRAQFAEGKMTKVLRALMVPEIGGAHKKIEFSPDGRFLKITQDLSGGIYQLVNIDGERLVEARKGGEIFSAVGFCEKTDRVALVSKKDAQVCEVWTAGMAEKVCEVDVESEREIRSLAFSPDGKLLFLGAEQGRFFDFEKRELWSVVCRHAVGSEIGHAVFNPKGDLLLTVRNRTPNEDQGRSRLQIYEVGGAGDPLFEAKRCWHWANLAFPTFLEGGEEIFYVLRPGLVRRVHARTGVEIGRHGRVPGNVDVSRLLGVNHLGVFGLEDGGQRIQQRLGRAVIRPGAATVIANKPTFREVSLRDGSLVRPLGLEPSEVEFVAVSSDGMIAAGWEESGLLRFWSLKEDYWDLPTAQAGTVTFSPSSEYLMNSGRTIPGGLEWGNRVQVFDTKTGAAAGGKILVEGHHSDGVFSPDETEVALGLNNRTVEIWDWREGTKIESFSVGSPVLCVRYAKNGEWLAVVCRNGNLLAVDRADGTVTTLVEHEKMRDSVRIPYSLKQLEFSEDGRWLVMWSVCEGVTIWDCERRIRVASPPLAEGCFVDLLKVKGHEIVFLEVDDSTQIYNVHEWNMQKEDWGMKALKPGQGRYSHLDVSDDGKSILLSRMELRFASLAEQGKDGSWTWRKVEGLGWGASFFVPNTSFAVGLGQVEGREFSLVDLEGEVAFSGLAGDEGQLFRQVAISPDGRQLAAVDWLDPGGKGRVWNLSALNFHLQQEETKTRQELAPLNSGGRMTQQGWEDLDGEDWLQEWKSFRGKYPEMHRLPAATGRLGLDD